MYHRITFSLVLGLVSIQSASFGQNVTTQRNDVARTGVNAAETTLTTANVRPASFGKLFSLPVDGQVYAQPLYLHGVVIPSKGTRNVVYVATENNSVYAFDADDPTQTSPLWHVTLGTPMHCSDIPWCDADLKPNLGITSTPVIDPATSTMYVVVETIVSASNPTVPKFMLHALNVTTGAEKFNGPMTITASVVGTGSDSLNGRITLNPLYLLQRPALLLANGTVYIAFGSHSDEPLWHGWVLAYDQRSLRQVAVRCLTPEGDFGGGGIWQGGVGPAADSAGNVYVVTGNGDLTAPTGGKSYGQSVVRLNGLSLAPMDYFAPNDVALTNAADADLGSGGPLLIPGTTQILVGGKTATMYLLDTTNLGGFNVGGNRSIQELTFPHQMFSGRIFYNSMLYVWPAASFMFGYQYSATPSVSNHYFPTSPTISTAFDVPWGYSNEPALSLSANGTTSGTAIIWATYSQSGSSDGGAYPGVLQAFDASTLSEIWGSEMNVSRDYSGSWSKWSPPTVANGKVYVPTFDNLVNVYGLLPR